MIFITIIINFDSVNRFRLYFVFAINLTTRHELSKMINNLKVSILLALVGLLYLTSCKTDSTKQYALSCLDTVQSEYYQHAPDMSIDMLNYSYHYFDPQKSPEEYARAHYLHAVICKRMSLGSDSEWYDDLTSACDVVKKTKNHELSGKIHLELGVEQIAHGWYEVALPTLCTSYDEATSADDITTRVLSLMNISRAYLLGELGCNSVTEAISNSKKALNLASHSGDELLESMSLFALCSCYQSLELYDEALSTALQYTNRSRELYNSGKRHEKVRYVQLARCYYHKNIADSAIFYANLSLDHDDIIERINACQLLCSIYSDIVEDPQMTMLYDNRYHKLRDTLDLSRHNDIILMNNAKMNIARVQETGRNRLHSVLLIFFILVSTLLVLFCFMRRKLKKQVEDLAVEKDKSGVLQEAVVSLKMKVLDKDNFITELKTNPRYLKDKDWERVKLVVEAMEPGYINRLESLGLTENAIRTAVATKAGFTTSECAVLFSIDPKSITKAKQRLKAKINQMST